MDYNVTFDKYVPVSDMTVPSRTTERNVFPTMNVTEWIARPINVKEVQVPSSVTAWSVFDTISLPAALFGEREIDVLKYFSGARFGISVKLIVRGTKMHYGKVLVALVPYPEVAVSSNQKNPVSLAHYPHQILDMNIDGEYNVSLPYIGQYDFLSTLEASFTDYCSLIFCTIAPIPAEVNSPASIVVYAKVDDLVLGPPLGDPISPNLFRETVQPVTETAQRKPRNVVEARNMASNNTPAKQTKQTRTSRNPLSLSLADSSAQTILDEVVSDVLDRVTLPFFYSPCLITGAYTEEAINLAKTKSNIPQYMRAQASLAAAEMVKTVANAASESLTEIKQAGLETGAWVSDRLIKRLGGIPHVDESSTVPLPKPSDFSSDIKGKYFLLDTITWREQDPFTILTVLPVSPTTTKLSTSSNERLMHSLAWYSKMFKRWRGTLSFKFEFCASIFHSGQINLRWDPGSLDSTQLMKSNAWSFNNTINIQQQTSFEMSVPFQALRRLLSVGASNGFLYLTTQSTLVFPDAVTTTKSPVYINIWMKAEDDFQFLGLVPTDLRLNVASNDSIQWIEKDMSTTFNPANTDIVNDNTLSTLINTYSTPLDLSPGEYQVFIEDSGNYYRLTCTPFYGKRILTPFTARVRAIDLLSIEIQGTTPVSMDEFLDDGQESNFYFALTEYPGLVYHVTTTGLNVQIQEVFGGQNSRTYLIQSIAFYDAFFEHVDPLIEMFNVDRTTFNQNEVSSLIRDHARTQLYFPYDDLYVPVPQINVPYKSCIYNTLPTIVVDITTPNGNISGSVSPIGVYDGNNWIIRPQYQSEVLSYVPEIVAQWFDFVEDGNAITMSPTGFGIYINGNFTPPQSSWVGATSPFPEVQAYITTNNIPVENRWQYFRVTVMEYPSQQIVYAVGRVRPADGLEVDVNIYDLVEYGYSVIYNNFLNPYLLPGDGFTINGQNFNIIGSTPNEKRISTLRPVIPQFDNPTVIAFSNSPPPPGSFTQLQAIALSSVSANLWEEVVNAGTWQDPHDVTDFNPIIIDPNFPTTFRAQASKVVGDIMNNVMGNATSEQPPDQQQVAGVSSSLQVESHDTAETTGADMVTGASIVNSDNNEARDSCDVVMNMDDPNVVIKAPSLVGTVDHVSALNNMAHPFGPILSNDNSLSNYLDWIRTLYLCSRGSYVVKLIPNTDAIIGISLVPFTPILQDAGIITSLPLIGSFTQLAKDFLLGVSTSIIAPPLQLFEVEVPFSSDAYFAFNTLKGCAANTNIGAAYFSFFKEAAVKVLISAGTDYSLHFPVAPPILQVENPDTLSFFGKVGRVAENIDPGARSTTGIKGFFQRQLNTVKNGVLALVAVSSGMYNDVVQNNTNTILGRYAY